MSQNESTLRHGQPLWLTRKRRARPVRAYPAFRGRSASDVVFVGGGMTGALVALTFAREGIPVTLLEAGCVGYGSTAASSALLLQEPDRGLADLAARYGRASSRRIWELGRDAVRDLTRTLHSHRIACDLVARDAVYYATSEPAVDRLRTEFRLRSRAGFSCAWLNAGAVRRAIGVAARGAIRTSGNAQFDPYKACLGLMKAARSAGADRPVRPGQTRSRLFAAATRELRADFEHLLPALADIGIDTAWEGLFALTPDSLPFIGPHRQYPGHLFALGYGGNGMTVGSLAARLLLEHWRGDRSPDHRLFRFSR